MKTEEKTIESNDQNEMISNGVAFVFDFRFSCCCCSKIELQEKKKHKTISNKTQLACIST